MRMANAARALNVSRRTLNYWLSNKTWEAGFLKPVLRISYKTVLIPRAGVAELAKLRHALAGWPEKGDAR